MQRFTRQIVFVTTIFFFTGMPTLVLHAQELGAGQTPPAQAQRAANAPALVPGAAAQAGSAAATTDQIRAVTVTQKGAAPSGPYPIVIEHDQRLATHTIYRPATLGPAKNPVVVWGEGACVKNGLTFPEYLSEIASYGFVVVADGPPVAPAPRGGQPGAAGPAAAPRGAQPGAAAPGGRGAAPISINADGTPLTAAIDWLQRESTDPASRFYQKVDTTRVAAMGMSCGGLMAYNISADPRVATVGIWNSGLLQPDEKIFAGVHSSVIIITGGESDIAYANGKRDFETMPARIPVFYGVYPSVGHGGTYNEDNGGAFGVAAVAWLKWQLMNDTTAKGYFVGSSCTLCANPQWKTDSRSLR
jgi:dienelactone hydrolase